MAVLPGLPARVCLLSTGQPAGQQNLRRLILWKNLLTGDSNKLGLWYVAPYIIGLLSFTAFPFITSFYLSFTDYNLLGEAQWVGTANYEKLLTRDRTFDQSLRATITFVALTVPLKLAVALFIATVLNYRLRGIYLFRTAFYIPSILGGSIAIGFLWRYVFASEGLVNMIITSFGGEPVNWFGDPQNAMVTLTLLRVWQFGSAMIIFLAALQSIDRTLYEAAAIDGAGPWTMFRNITLPLITPVIFFNLILQTAEAFQEFTAPYIVTGGGPLKSTYFLPLYIYDEAFKNFQFGYASALSWVLFAIVMSLALVAFWSSKKWVYYADDRRG